MTKFVGIHIFDLHVQCRIVLSSFFVCVCVCFFVVVVLCFVVDICGLVHDVDAVFLLR